MELLENIAWAAGSVSLLVSLSDARGEVVMSDSFERPGT
jgi:hypothetical protein